MEDPFNPNLTIQLKHKTYLALWEHLSGRNLHPYKVHSVHQNTGSKQTGDRQPYFRALASHSKIISVGMVIPPYTRGPGMISALQRPYKVEHNSLCNHPAWLNSGTKTRLAFFKAASISFFGQGRMVLILIKPTLRPCSPSWRTASRAWETHAPEATRNSSASGLTTSIRSPMYFRQYLAERSTAAKTSCCQLACMW